MKKQILLGLVLMISGLGFNQTETVPDVGPNWCGHYNHQQQIYDQHPEYELQDNIDQENFQNFYEDFLLSWNPGDRAAYIIPVVVHVVHLGGEENISDEQIENGILKLNEDFGGYSPDLGNTIAAFSGITGFPDVEFRLATKDPNGNCHRGITRTYSNTTYDDGSGAIINAVAAAQGTWPQNKYMNIFICMDPSGAAGYTNYPSSWYPAGSMQGSIMLRHDYMGVIGTSNPSARHTLSHEAGHWFNLRHCWGNSNNPGQSSNCSEDDLVGDTPNTEGWTSCITSGTTCSSLDNVQNIMEYSYCSTMFTQGQAARIVSALNSGTAGRNNLWTGSNLNATGTNGPGAICEAIMNSDINVICVGSSIQFYDESFHTVTSRTWTFDGGTPGTSTVEDPIITFNTPGIYNVTLQVSDGSTTLTTTETAYIVVLGDPGGQSIAYSEGFETLVSFPDNQFFLVENEDNAQQWALESGTGSSGTECVKLSNFGVTNNSTDAFISGTIDLSGVDPADDIVFNFKYAYNKRSSANDESLKFYISKDCGETWVLRKNLSGGVLGNDISTSPYTPVAGSSDWQQANVTTINSDYYVSNFRFKFEFENDGGNNCYVDDINLYAASTVNTIEIENPNALSVYPNPVTNVMTVSLYGKNGEEYTIDLYNAIGQKIENVFAGQLVNGQNLFTYNTAGLTKGLYIIKVASEGRLQTIKLIKE